jgi:hypothetical protein
MPTLLEKKLGRIHWANGEAGAEGSFKSNWSFLLNQTEKGKVKNLALKRIIKRSPRPLGENIHTNEEQSAGQFQGERVFFKKGNLSSLDEGVVDPVIGGDVSVNNGEWYSMAERAILTSSGVKGQIRPSACKSFNKAKEWYIHTTSASA